MTPPRKRPRLSMFEDDDPGIELHNARYHNDMTLKSRFELIFAKYAQDFTGIGDEIDTVTGEVVVNNGHLNSMKTETDLGVTRSAGDFTSTGRSMLRAMTASLDSDLPGPDDVLMSIEMIAEKAAMTDSSVFGNSDDDLSDTPGHESAFTPELLVNEVGENWDRCIKSSYDSESDSLFNGQRSRSGSVDSLFDGGCAQGEYIDHGGYQTETSTPIPNNEFGHADNDIIARFGPHIGKEVLHLIDQRQEAHIEPAWRIPVKLSSAPSHQHTPLNSKSLSAEPILANQPGNQFESLWKISRPVKTRNMKSNRQLEHREDSIDPLQEDMSSEFERLPSHESEKNYDTSSYNFELDSEAETQGDYDNSYVHELILEAARDGECPYCGVFYVTKSGVMLHWDRVIRNLSKRMVEDDPHDIDVMREIRAKKKRVPRHTRLVLYDFRTMLELHEGAGMSFDEIVSSKTLRTHKNSHKLQEIYNQHRTPPNWAGTPVPTRAWSDEEKIKVQEFCKNPLTTIHTIRRNLFGRDFLEIGNYLADMWLSQLGVGKDQVVQNTQVEPQSNLALAEMDESDIQEMKREYSEDELFG